ncbi:hypothetical protein [Ralstonia phage RP31]|uniref:Uncharacterized protein n=2 Tax=Ripduovirus RP12 TaxID=2560700 RepID=A0A1L7N0P6_9CAUD|nr:hypothetical protein FDH28_gp068 [Ralstonia phage RP12]BAW19042.1 hypothetical protein [Ralstonia phage RP12]BAW19327.1 hypothetical protein [Ralstonia phage RP31]
MTSLLDSIAYPEEGQRVGFNTFWQFIVGSMHQKLKELIQ